MKTENWKLKIILIFFVLGVAFSHDAHAGTIIKAPAYLGLNGGLVGYWPFDGSDYHLNGVSTDTTDDRSGNGNNGSVNTNNNILPVPVAGKIGQAFSFDGSEAFIDLHNPTIVDANINISISVWIYLRTTNYYAAIAVKSPAFNGPSAAYALTMYDSYQNLSWIVNGNQVFSTNTIPLNTWTHVVVTSNANGRAIYINGVPETFAATTAPASSVDNWIFGQWTHDQSGNFPGSLDDVRIYSRALSANEISRLYRIGLGSSINHSGTTSANDKGLVGYWTFDGADIHASSSAPGVPYKIDDKSGNNNFGITHRSPVTTGGKIGQALSFDSFNYVAVADNSSLHPSSVTLSLWLKSSSYDSTNYLSATGYIVTGEASSIGFGICGVGQCQTVDANFSLNSWHHVVGIYNAASNTENLYVDGVLSADSPRTPSIVMDQSPSDFRIGCTYVTETCGFGSGTYGSIDDVRIYNRVLSVAEIQNLYNETQSQFNVSKTDSLVNGLVGYWTFDGKDMGSSGTIAKDRSGNNNKGTLSGANGLPVAAQGKVGQALRFDGVDDYVNVTANSSLSNISPITITGWINLRTNDVQDIISKTNNGSGGGIGLELYYSGNIWFSRPFNGTGGRWRTSSDPITIGKWHFISVTYTSTDGTDPIIYVDGVPRPLTMTVGPSSGGATDDSAQDFSFGTYGAQSNPCCFINGSIDDLRIYNRILSAGEINKLYQMGR